MWRPSPIASVARGVASSGDRDAPAVAHRLLTASSMRRPYHLHRLSSFAVALVAIAAPACGSADAVPLAPHHADAATTIDGGAADETSIAPEDSGAPTPTDSGSPTTTTDSGTPTTTTDTGTPTTTTDSGTPTTTTDSGTPTTTDAGGTTTKTLLGQYVITWYSFQDNTPVNSALSASGRKLVPYISVAVPFRLLKDFGGKLNYGDQLYLEFLAGRTMPDGTKHSGWVEIDDFCGDSGDDSYCFQTVGGKSYPNTDLYIGDFTKSAMDPKACTGPAGDGQQLTNVYTGSAGAAWIGNYGGAALGSGKCGDINTAKPQQAGCWDYTPPASSSSDCAGCSATSCTSW
jgi:hypothetical protein